MFDHLFKCIRNTIYCGNSILSETFAISNIHIVVENLRFLQ